jgi:long-subunit fatty acid transport protein
VIALWSAAALAGGFEVAQQSGAAGGTGHAGTARVDAAAGWFNPAALADSEGVRLAVGAAVARSAIRSTDSEGAWESRSDNALGTPPHLYASWSDKHVLVGVAVNTAFAGGVRWPADSPLRFYSLESAPRFFRVAPFAGVGVGPVRLAAGLHVDAGSLYVARATDHVTEEGQAQLSLRGAGVGPDLAAFLQLPMLDIGLSYKGRTRLKLEGEADFDVPPAFASGLPDQPISSQWRLPDRLALGLALDTGPVTVLFDAVYTAWSVNDTLPIDFSDPATDDAVQLNAWRDTLALRTGAELGLAKIVTLRAGGYVDGVPGPPSPPETLGPSSPDGTRLGATLGAGVGLGEHVRLDGYGEAMALLPRTSTSPDAPSARYQGHALVAGLTASLRF